MHEVDIEHVVSQKGNNQKVSILEDKVVRVNLHLSLICGLFHNVYEVDIMDDKQDSIGPFLESDDPIYLSVIVRLSFILNKDDRGVLRGFLLVNHIRLLISLKEELKVLLFVEVNEKPE